MDIAKIALLFIVFILSSCATKTNSLISSHKITYLDSEHWISHRAPKVAIASDLWLESSRVRQKTKKMNKKPRRLPSSVKIDNTENLEYKVKESSSNLIGQIKTVTPREVTDFISNGTDPDLQDKKGNTALHYAVLFVNIPVVKALIENGASKTIKNKNGEMPFDLIKKIKKNN